MRSSRAPARFPLPPQVAHATPRYARVMGALGQEVLLTPDRLTKVGAFCGGVPARGGLGGGGVGLFKQSCPSGRQRQGSQRPVSVTMHTAGSAGPRACAEPALHLLCCAVLCCAGGGADVPRDGALLCGDGRLAAALAPAGRHAEQVSAARRLFSAPPVLCSCPPSPLASCLTRATCCTAFWQALCCRALC